MRLVKLTSVNGGTLLVNPEQVVDISVVDRVTTIQTTAPDTAQPGGGVLSALLRVKESPEEVARLLAGGGQVLECTDAREHFEMRGRISDLTAEVERLRSTIGSIGDEGDDIIAALKRERDGWIKRHDEQAANGISLLTRATDAERERDEARAALRPVIEAALQRERFTDEDVNPDYHLEITVSVAEARAMVAAVEAAPAPEPEETDPLGPITENELDAAAPATPTEPESGLKVPESLSGTTTIDARSRIAIEVTGECVVQPELGPRGERTVWVRRQTQMVVNVPNGLLLHGSDKAPEDWSARGFTHWTSPFRANADATMFMWTSDPTVDVNRHKDAKYADPCVLHVRVVPDGEEMPTMPSITSVSFDRDPAFFDPDAILAFVNTDPEAQRQVRVIGSYGNDTLHHRRHQEARQGTGLAGLCFNPEATDPKKRFTDGNHGWDALGDALLVLLEERSTAARISHWDETRESALDILRSKLIENPLCQTPFGLVGKNWNEPSPFRHWYGRAAYRSFVDVLDLALAYKLLQDAGLVSAVLSPMDEAHVRSNFRRFAAFVEADMAVSDPRMWRTSNVLAVECLRHLFPSLGLPDLSGFLTRWDGDTENDSNSVLTPEDPPRWLDKGDYTGHGMMGVCYSVWAWVMNGRTVLPHFSLALRIWTGMGDDWMWAKKTGTPQAGQDHRCARFQNSLTQLWFPVDLSDPKKGKTTERVLGEQDHALYVVAGSRVAS